MFRAAIVPPVPAINATESGTMIRSLPVGFVAPLRLSGKAESNGIAFIYPTFLPVVADLTPVPQSIFGNDALEDLGDPCLPSPDSISDLFNIELESILLGVV